MSATDPFEATRPRQPLGIIHLLGWITGIAVVLALYRWALDSGWLDVSPAYQEELRWWQLGYGLVYGTAISTAGLLIYRRICGDRRFPSQPGHWLLLFGALAFAADVLAFVLSKAIVALWKRQFEWDPGWYYFQQALVWSFALLVASIVLSRLRAQWNWRLLAVLIAMLIATNCLTNSLVVFSMWTQAMGLAILSGGWPYYLVHWAQIVAVGICLLAIPIVVGCDRHPRDWLHWVGIVATTALGLVEEANQILTLSRAI